MISQKSEIHKEKSRFMYIHIYIYMTVSKYLFDALSKTAPAPNKTEMNKNPFIKSRFLNQWASKPI